MNLASLTEYAKKHGKAASGVRRLAKEGRFKTAVKIGKTWIVDIDEPFPEDKRLKSGKYVDFRKNKRSG